MNSGGAFFYGCSKVHQRNISDFTDFFAIDQDGFVILSFGIGLCPDCFAKILFYIIPKVIEVGVSIGNVIVKEVRQLPGKRKPKCHAEKMICILFGSITLHCVDNLEPLTADIYIVEDIHPGVDCSKNAVVQAVTGRQNDAGIAGRGFGGIVTIELHGGTSFIYYGFVIITQNYNWTEPTKRIILQDKNDCTLIITQNHIWTVSTNPLKMKNQHIIQK